MTVNRRLLPRLKQRVALNRWPGLVLAIGLISQFTACDSSSGDAGGTAGGPPDGPVPAGPTVGAHALVFQRLGGGLSTIRTPAMSTFAVGSTLVVSVGRGDIGAFELPVDNMNNAPYMQQNSVHAYTNWPQSGTALYTLVNANGGAGHIVSTATPPSDEITLAVVEVFGGQVLDVAWNEILVGQPLTSESVTTAGPATLIAFWWGDAGVDSDKTARPDGNFTVVDSILASGALVQCAVAVRHVNAAGSYNVTWTATPAQGAQMWLVAVAD